MKRQIYRRFVIESLEGRQMLDASSVLISEIMYNPALSDQERAAGLKDRDYEFIELHNTGDLAVNLAAAALDDAVSFTFGQVTLGAGQFAVVVRNRRAFEARYGRMPYVIGEYNGTLGNGGDHVLLNDSSGSKIADVTFDDSWYSVTDGGGFSLTAVNPTAGPTNRDQPAHWKPSSRTGGSPGYDDGAEDPRPNDLTVTVLSSRHVALRWNPPTQVNAGVQDYRLYRNDQLLASLRETAFTDATVVPEGIYSYQVSIVHADGTEFLSNPVPVAIETVGGNMGFGQGISRGLVPANGLVELSGLVASRSNRNVLWTHNDGPQTSVHAIGTQGEYLGAFHLEGIRSHDWEDIAIGPGPEAGVDYLYIGDIGGTKPKRNVIQVVRVPEPALSENDPAQTRVISDFATITLQYPDGDEFNAETLLSDPLTGDLFVIPKRGSGSPVYRAAAYQLTSGSVVFMELVVELKFPSVSGGDISPTGKEIVIRTEDFAQLFARGETQSVAGALAGTPIDVPVVGRPAEPNGESITFESTGYGFFTISEGEEPPLYYFPRVPTGQAGDANRDQQFDQVDIIMALRGGKYLTREPANWSQGDWNGDGVFDNLDIVSALQTGNYLQGR